ncbi:MAG: propionyl-CoA carboxylase [Oscillospiraceae bacterium]|nr:propionyl-CoA carboxylase [Oscillospiraceae bacterium]MBQ5341098.1 propionyl-CoA carboxylase [Oscillospiraceae bacterium]
MADKQQKLDALQRLTLLFDDGAYELLDGSADTGARIAHGTVYGTAVFAYVEGGCGAFSTATAGKLAKVYDLAEKTGSPVVAVYDSKGVDLQGGGLTLDACAELLHRCSRVSGVVPQIAVVAGTCGGFESVCASLADVCLMESKAEFFLTAPFNDLSDSDAKKIAGSAEYAQKASAAAVVCDGEEALFAKTRQLVGMLPSNNLEAPPFCDFSEPEKNAADDAVLGTVDAGSEIELFAGKGLSSRTYLATVLGSPVGVVSVSGRVCRNDSLKISRLVQLCDAFSVPVVTFLDSEGFLVSADNDMNGGIRNAAILAHNLSQATTVKVTVVTGNAIGSLFSVICGRSASDFRLAWNGAVIGELAPKAAVAVMWSDRIEKDSDIERLAVQYAAEEESAEKAFENGIIDKVITPETTRSAVSAALDMLAPKRVSNISRKHGNMPY